MAIGPIHIAWMKRLADRGHFAALQSVIDLGPQDIQADRTVLETLARSMLPAKRADTLINKIFEGQVALRTAQRDFYSIFGLTEYSSIDADDDRAVYKLNLNYPISGLPEFDVVTNFGTTEHVFNIGEAFRSIHELTRPGGLNLHAVPSFAFINHGFYNIHPNVLIEIARVNGYELVDFSYVDNAFCRNQMLGREGIESLDFDDLPIRLTDMENSQVFMTKVVDTFYRNLIATETSVAIEALGKLAVKDESTSYPGPQFQICYVFDLIFVALRRSVERRPFTMPMQDPGGVRPLGSLVDIAAGASWMSWLKGAVRRAFTANHS